MGEVGRDGGDSDAEDARSSGRVDVADLIAIYAGHAGINPEHYTLRELATIAETAWQKTARVEAAIRDGLTPRKDKHPWDVRLFNPLLSPKLRKRSMTSEDVRRYAGQFKKVRIVSAKDVRVQKDEQ